MKLEITTGCRFQEDDNLALEVQAPASIITVKAGGFRYGGIDRQLVEDQSYSAAVPDPAKATTITGYLVAEKATAQVRLMVDEVPADGTGPFNFASSASPYELIAQLFVLQVPANTADHSSLTCTVFKVSPKTRRRA